MKSRADMNKAHNLRSEQIIQLFLYNGQVIYEEYICFKGEKTWVTTREQKKQKWTEP